MGDQLKFGALNNLFGFHLRQAYTPFGKAYREASANFKLKPSQFTVLELINHNPGRRQSELAEALDIERSNFMPIIDALESRGLLIREKSRADRRSYSMEVTPKGKALVTKATAPILAESDRAAAVLSDLEQETLKKLLCKLYCDKQTAQ